MSPRLAAPGMQCWLSSWLRGLGRVTWPQHASVNPAGKLGKKQKPQCCVWAELSWGKTEMAGRWVFTAPGSWIMASIWMTVKCQLVQVAGAQVHVENGDRNWWQRSLGKNLLRFGLRPGTCHVHVRGSRQLWPGFREWLLSLREEAFSGVFLKDLSFLLWASLILLEYQEAMRSAEQNSAVWIL